jgi:hypothetical protein
VACPHEEVRDELAEAGIVVDNKDGSAVGHFPVGLGASRRAAVTF